MSWHENMCLAAAVGVVSVGLASALAVMGYWMALPFAGAELLALIGCLHKTVHRLDEREIITIGRELITLEWGRKSPQKRVKVPRQWSRLAFSHSDNPFEVGLLSLLIHNKSYKLGNALGKEEKKQLFKELKVHFTASQVRMVPIN